MAVGTLARKDLRLLLRDPRAAVILVVMPLVLILVLGLALGEGFGQKPDDRLRVSLVVEDAGLPPNAGPYPGEPWSTVVQRDLEQTAGLRVEIVPTRAQAEALVRRGERSAVLVFGREFSARMHRCSFLSATFLKKEEQPAINPFFRDGVDAQALGVEILRDPTQTVASSIIEQVAQVTLLRVVMPWMIGRAFDKVGEKLPIAAPLLQQMFSQYDLRAKNWAALTKSTPADPTTGSTASVYAEPAGGLLGRGAVRYQILVPSYTVMFAFFLVLSAGWLFVGERRLGTLLRLRAAPLARWQLILGKLLPCYAISVAQGTLLLVAGKLVFGMSWGSAPWALAGVVLATSFAATGLAVLIAAISRTETQVAITGTLVVLALAGVSGCLMPRDLMPDAMKAASRLTPHAWALDAYGQLLLQARPDLTFVGGACLALVGFGTGFLALAWWLLPSD